MLRSLSSKRRDVVTKARKAELQLMERAISRYLWVHNSLKAQIEAEDFKVGDFLPPEPELQRTFQVSRTTVRKAVEMLAQQGFVYIRQGKGTQILDFKATQKARVRHIFFRDAPRAGIYRHAGRYPCRLRLCAAADRRGSRSGARTRVS